MAGRSAISLTLLAAVMAGANACGTADAREGITLRFWGLGREGEIVASLIPEFERQNPGIHVEVQQIPWTAAHEKLVTAYVGDASPDVSQLGNTWVPEFVALGALAPLDERVRASALVAPDAYFPGIWQTNLVDDTLFGVPWYVDTRLIFYRTDLLARAGYDSMPQSWNDWYGAMERMRDQMGKDAYPLLLPTNEWNVPVILALQAGSTILRDDGRYGAFEQPAFRRAFEFWNRIFRDSLAPTLGLTQISNVYQEIARGRFDMFITGPWNIGEFRARLPDSLQDVWSTAPMPGPGGPQAGVSLAGGSSLVVYRASAHQDAAWRLVEYLSAPEQQKVLYRLTGDLPSRTEAWEDSALAHNAYARAFRVQLERVVPTPKVPEWEQIAQKIAEYGDAVARGSMTVDEALPALDRDVNAMLEKRRYLLDRQERLAEEDANDN